jgi:hypothetical protein
MLIGGLFASDQSDVSESIPDFMFVLLFSSAPLAPLN